jgi:hypothetical protein
VAGGRNARTAAALLGLPLSTYTAALVTNTAVPAWHESRRTLPFAFAGGAAASAGAALTALTPVSAAAPARRLAVAGTAAEILATELTQHQLGDLADAYRSGATHRLGTASTLSLGAGAALISALASRSRWAAVAGGALVTAGSLLARWSVFKAGFQSATDRRHTIVPQRDRIAKQRRSRP